MKENIGHVALDYTYYPGEDLYSDGAVEDEMLDIAREYSPGDFNRVIGERKSWPILYHFSHIRENIVSWLPFDGEEKVLEIGSGCGAVTGALCAKAKEVTCIELSKKRSEINAWRHRDRDNLTILVGNFQDIEKTLTEKYDYITLIGVFEYGESYIQSETPYVDFLKIIAGHLKPQGKIILAIENRFGLKYWAGCTEDHFGTLFEGLEGYPRTKGVKTFTQKELTAVLREAGNLKGRWYYPYPDYKFPMTIYSGERLPAKGELNRLEESFDRFRLNLFQESAVYDSLLDNDLYPQFANSFLVLLGQEEIDQETVYAKFSNERDRRFSIRTEICRKGEQGLLVEKVPDCTEALEHVRNLKKISEKLSKAYAGEGLAVNTCTLDGDRAKFEYLQGFTLEEKLDSLLAEGREGELEELLLAFCGRIKRIHRGERFVETPGFVKVFGQGPENLECGAVSNIDLVPANIFLSGGKAYVIDYEWSFFFPVPANFIVYRTLHYYLESDGKREGLKRRDFYKKAGITEKELEIYAQMEKNFQSYMVGEHVPMLAMYEDISPGKLDVLPYFQEVSAFEARRMLQVFTDCGGDFSEENSRCYPMTKKGISVKLPMPEGTRRLRLDPGEAKEGLEVKRLCWDGEKSAQFVTNGFPLGENRYFFGGGDPQLILEDVPAGAGSLTIELGILDKREAWESLWEKCSRTNGAVERRVLELEAELAGKKRLIHEMENTKVWKLYRSLKKDGKS